MEREQPQARLHETMTEDRRAALHVLRGVLVYLELQPSETHVHERDCKWPHDVDSNRARAVRRHTTHTIGNARRYRDLSLRVTGFQLFGSGDGVPMAPPSQHSGDLPGIHRASRSPPSRHLAALHTRRAMMRYVRDVEAFVLTKLQDGRNFHLAPGERVHSAAAYNHVVRCSGERGRPREGESSQSSQSSQSSLSSRSPQSSRSSHRAQQSPRPVGGQPRRGQLSHPAGDHVINEVHTDFTAASGPVVLRHLLRDGGTPRTYGGAAGRAVAGPGGLPPHRGTRDEVEASPSADEILRGDRADDGDSWRYVFLNVWQSMDREAPVREAPLALLHPRSWSLDGRTHAVKLKTHAIFPENYTLRSDVRRVPAAAAAPAAAELLQPRQGEAGDVIPFAHEWVHYPEMTADEALVFVNFDSDSTQPQFVMHGAVEDAAEVKAEVKTDAEGDAEAEDSRREDESRTPRRRISVEVRLLVLIQREGEASRARRRSST